MKFCLSPVDNIWIRLCSFLCVPFWKRKPKPTHCLRIDNSHYLGLEEQHHCGKPENVKHTSCLTKEQEHFHPSRQSGWSTEPPPWRSHRRPAVMIHVCTAADEACTGNSQDQNSHLYLKSLLWCHFQVTSECFWMPLTSKSLLPLFEKMGILKVCQPVVPLGMIVHSMFWRFLMKALEDPELTALM